MIIKLYVCIYMSCENCNQSLLNGVYYCDTSDYRVIDNMTDKNLIFIFKNHELLSDDIEINDNVIVQYCNFNNCKYIKYIEDKEE